MKIFRTTSRDVIIECKYWFRIPDLNELISVRKQKFLLKYSGSENERCHIAAVC